MKRFIQIIILQAGAIISRGLRVSLLHSQLPQSLQMNRVGPIRNAQAPCGRPPEDKNINKALRALKPQLTTSQSHGRLSRHPHHGVGCNRR